MSNEDGVVTKTLGPGVEVDAYLYDAVHIEPTAMQEEYIRVAPDLAYWNARHARVLRDHLLAKLNVDRVNAREKANVARAEADAQFNERDNLIANGIKITEAMVAAKVASNAAVVAAKASAEVAEHAARLAVIETEVERTRLHGVVEAIRAKKDMLTSIGADIRSERQGDPSLRSVARDVRTREENERG